MNTGTALTMTLALAGLALPRCGASTQIDGIEVLLPGEEWYRTEGPRDAAGDWWVIHVTGGETLLELRPVLVETFQACGDESPDEKNGRIVGVPGVTAPVLLVRGLAGATAGPLRTAFPASGIEGESVRIELTWGGRPIVIRHETDEPADSSPWRHRVTYRIDDREFTLHEDDLWQGDGHWALRWVGDLNRDGWPDLLLDASYKYSMYTTRLFVSNVMGRDVTIGEVATFEHSAC